MKKLLCLMLAVSMLCMWTPAFADEAYLAWDKIYSTSFSKQENIDGAFSFSTTDDMTITYPEDNGVKIVKTKNDPRQLYIHSENPHPYSTNKMKVGVIYQTDQPTGDEIFRMVICDKNGKSLGMMRSFGGRVGFGTTSSYSSQYVLIDVPVGEPVEIALVFDPVKYTATPYVNGSPVGERDYKGSLFPGYASYSGAIPQSAETILYMAANGSYIQFKEFYIQEGYDVTEECSYQAMTSEKANKITQDLNFLSNLENGAIVTYSSTKPHVIDETGKVTRGTQDEAVTVTAHILFQGQLVDKKFNFIVMAENKEENNIFLEESEFDGQEENWLLSQEGGTAKIADGKLNLTRNSETGAVSATKYFITNLPEDKYVINGEKVVLESYLVATDGLSQGKATVYNDLGETLGRFGIEKSGEDYRFVCDYENGSTEIPYTEGSEIYVKYEVNTLTNTVNIYVDNVELDSAEVKKTQALGGVSSVVFEAPSGTDKGTFQIDNVNLLLETDNKDKAIAALDADNLQLSALTSQAADLIAYDLLLNASARLGSTLTYKSSNPDVIDDFGFVKRQEKDEPVTMTVTISKGTESQTKTFDFVVKGKNPYDLAVGKTSYASDSTVDCPKENAVDYLMHTAWKTTETENPYITVLLGNDVKLNKVVLKETKNDADEYGVTGFTIDVSDNNRIWKTVAEGTTIGAEKAITFDDVQAKFVRYRVSSMTGNETGLYEFEVYYEPKSADAFELDKEALSIMGDYMVTGDLNLVTVCKYGSQVTWTSSHPDIISNTGALLSSPKKDTIVTLTAHITNGEYSCEKTFKRLVKGNEKIQSGSGTGDDSKSPVKSIASAGTVKPVITQETSAFYDVDKARWSYKYIDKLQKEGIISGDGSGNFYPDRPVTREEFVTMLVRGLLIQGAGESAHFADMESGAWYESYISVAVSQGIVKGETEATFGIGKPITREDMAVMAVRALRVAGITLKETTKSEYDDETKISDYAQEAVKLLSNGGIICGYDGRFMPKDYLTREQSAKIICLIGKELQ